MTGVTRVFVACGRGSSNLWNAVVSLGENRKRASTCGQGIGYHQFYRRLGTHYSFGAI